VTTRLLYPLVFVAGAATMSTEMSASRLLAPFFGSSILIWANIIGLILIYLSAGYFLGGRLADRHPHLPYLARLMIFAAAAISVTPFLAQPLLDLAVGAFADASVGAFLGSFFAAMLIFSVPITLLGMASPFAIRLGVVSVERAGEVAGRMYALSTAGSILGTAIGSRLHAVDPDRLVLISAGVATAVTVVAAFFFSLPMAALVAGVSAVTNALGKVALDAIIQREVPESLRASAFSKSETILQLAWVIGGAIGIALPAIGWLGFTVAAALLVLAVGLILFSLHRGRRAAAQAVRPEASTTPLGEQWG